MLLDVLIHHDGDGATGEARARALMDDLRPGERIVVRDRAAGGLDPAVRHAGDLELAAGEARERDAVLLLDSRPTPEPALLDALRRPPREWDAWTAVVVTPDGRTVAAAGVAITFLGRSHPQRSGMPVAALPESPFWCAGLPAGLIAVRRSALDGLPGVLDHGFPADVALDLALRLRSAGGRCGVLPAARVRAAPADDPIGTGTVAGRMRAAATAYPGAVLAAAAPAALAAAPVRMARPGGAAEVRAAAAALRSAMRERRAGAPLRSLDGATFADALSADGGPATGAADRVTGALARAWWGSAAATMRAARARSRRRAARTVG